MMSVSTENTLYVIQRSKQKTSYPQALKKKNKWRGRKFQAAFWSPNALKM